MICASEQSVIVVDAVYEAVKEEFRDRGAYFLTPEDKEKVGRKIIIDGRLNAEIVGQSVETLAQLADISIPANTRVLMGEVKEISTNEPFAYEKLSPILAMYRAANFEDAVDKAQKLIEFGGMGHTAVLYTAPSNKEHIKYYESKVETARVLINTPSSQGAIGDLYNFRRSLPPIIPQVADVRSLCQWTNNLSSMTTALNIRKIVGLFPIPHSLFPKIRSVTLKGAECRL